ncbi:hypothetical protein [Neptuniibacter caesariensis]|uniref:Uncharacterized protein n=1 Tax=Neptuniibacter caesariensis TaxID=207954 RepID=A0A7U8C1M0_NEPCE|nr:hypothetical protein [Neptuniibacter caesariensis]EAR59798.1 hypothetical protein MED92_08550 [Oceanospirillum sp. MED92] [Neptuniibacter caesariensis]
MPYQTNAWSKKHLTKMNDEPFMIEFLDTFKISPVGEEMQLAIDNINDTLRRVESEIRKN